MTLKRQWVQSLSDHKTGRTFCVSQERWIVEGMVSSKTKVVVKGGKWVRLGRETKNTSKTTIETDKEKIKKENKKEKENDSFAV